MIQITTAPRQSITIQGQADPVVTIQTAPAQTISLKASAPRGSDGPAGPQGPAGPVGSIDGLELPDFILIFENHLI